MMFSSNRRRFIAVTAFLLVRSVHVLNAQQISITQLDSLIRVALANNPRLTAWEQRANAARARIKPAGTWPDPMASLGVMNFPITQPGYDDMTMNAVELRQTVPYPGKLSLMRRAAESEARASELMIDVARRELVRDVRLAYYSLAYLDAAIRISNERRALLDNTAEAAKARYVAGAADQSSVLKAQLEAALAARERAELLAQREAALAELNTLLNRSGDVAVDGVRLPERTRPLPPLQVLLSAGSANNADVRAHEPLITAQSFNVDLARKASRPDIDVSILYGQRPSRPDMVSLMLGVPIPLHRNSRQAQGVAEATARLHELHAEHDSLVVSLRGSVTRLYAEIRGLDAQIDVLSRSALPDAKAVVASALASYQSGRADMVSVISTQSAVFESQLALQRALADRVSKIAQLEALTGEEMLS